MLYKDFELSKDGRAVIDFVEANPKHSPATQMAGMYATPIDWLKAYPNDAQAIAESLKEPKGQAWQESIDAKLDKVLAAIELQNAELKAEESAEADADEGDAEEGGK